MSEIVTTGTSVEIADSPGTDVTTSVPPRPFQEPLLVIKPRTKALTVDWKGIWNSRELLYFLVWRDILIRYKQTVLGAVWDSQAVVDDDRPHCLLRIHDQGPYETEFPILCFTIPAC